MLLTLLPTINALLNATAALLLLLGYRRIRRGEREAHRATMLAAFGASSLFLVGYLTLHALVGATRFSGQGWIRPVYFALLGSHTLLAAGVVPLALAALWLGLSGRFERHRAVARWTLPLWLYVSVTGVAIYLVLYHLYPGRG